MGILMNNGEIFSDEEISELTNHIINKFAEKNLSVDKAKIVLKRIEDLIGEYSTVKSTNL